MILEATQINNDNLGPMDQQAKAVVEILVPVARRFTLNFHPQEAGLGEEYGITLEVLQDPGLFDSAPFLPLRLTMESCENEDLTGRCLAVLKAGYITAKGELVIDRQEDFEGSLGQCAQLMHVHWFDAVDPCQGIEPMAPRADEPDIEYIGGLAA